MVGSLAGTDSRFADPNSQVSSHFGVDLRGVIHQYVPLDSAAWANGSPNPGMRWTLSTDNANLRTVSIETEDLGRPDTEPVTDEQYQSTLGLCRLAIQRWPGVRYLVAHRVINPGHSCPAARWLDSGRFAELGAELGLTVLT